MGGQEEIKPLGQTGQYVSFPSTFLLLPFLSDNELSYHVGQINCLGICLLEWGGRGDAKGAVAIFIRICRLRLGGILFKFLKL